MNSRSRTARLPPAGLPGLDPAWSKLVRAPDQAGITRTWHVLDTGAQGAGDTRRGTVLCVHGNPNWSFMWRGLARELADWRVIAVDALNMGYSERIGEPRLLADHVADLVSVTDALDIDGPVITVAHDWGGPISMGWAQQNIERLAGFVLLNTGVARPEAVRVPPLISLARATLRATCETTPTFLHGAFRMARPQLPRDVYRSYTAPYDSAPRRTGIRDFVEDIPIEESHRSYDTLASIANGLEQLQHLPALLLWGAKDVIFSDAFLHDLRQRLPQADVHRYADAGHQIVEDTNAIEVINNWISTRLNDLDNAADSPSGLSAAPRLWSAIDSRRGETDTAIIEMDPTDSAKIARSISFDELDERVHAMCRGLAAFGIQSGDRLATLVPPGIDLTVLLYACLRAGIVVVAPDAALGLGGMRRALRSSRPDFIVGDWKGLAFAASLRLPATRISVNQLPTAASKAGEVTTSLAEIVATGRQLAADDAPLPRAPASTEAAAIVFTSGSTGPSKGVVYNHGQLEAQRDALNEAFAIEPTDKLVVAFAPFALLAPALGIASAIPAMDVTAPAELRAQTLAEAAAAIDASIVFASPAVLRNVAASAPELTNTGRAALAQVHSVATAGAPVSPQLLSDVEPVFPHAAFFTPYGMTEVLPVTIASADEISATGSDAGTCVGTPLPIVDVAIRPIDAPSGTLPAALAPGQLGEVWVRADHRCAGYDQLWAQQHHGFVDEWHRSGDVGHVDAMGRLWIEGRVDHLIRAASGAVAPVPVELQAESVSGVDQAAAVGIGPVGTQELAVVVTTGSARSNLVADADLTAAVRAAVTERVAAVLVAPRMPVDRRHNSKIDRTRVQNWAHAVLRGDLRPRL